MARPVTIHTSGERCRLGSAVLATSSVANLGWVGASAEIAAVLLVFATTLKAAPLTATPGPIAKVALQS
jgi:hypothetical protein